MKKYLILLLFISFPACAQSTKKNDEAIHKAHLSDGWYSQNRQTLVQNLSAYLNIAKQHFPIVCDSNTVKALIVPHAGLYFSGLCGATAYQSLIENNNRKNQTIKKVIILAPTHTKAFHGIALPNYNVYKTVLGEIEIDKNAIKKLKNNLFKIDKQAHEQEHAIEIQLPFLQQTIQTFNIVPLIVGQIAKNEYDQIIEKLKSIIDENTLVVISSDFVHCGKSFNYTPFNENIFYNIKNVDSLAIEAISNLSSTEFSKVIQNTKATICGHEAIKILLKLIEQSTWPKINPPNLACYYNSAQLQIAKKDNKNSINTTKLLQTVSDPAMQHSVSYASLVFSNQDLSKLKKQDLLTGYEKKALLNEARNTIENNFESDKIAQNLLYPIKSAALSQKAGAFVTLNKKDGNLRGCIGRIITPDPLYKTVAAMSFASAFQDTRFNPLTKDEFNDVIVDITVLTPPKQIQNYKDIILGTHGIILKKDGLSAVFLPQVPGGFGWDLQTTLEHLSQKTGLPKDGWKQNCNFEVFEGFEIKEK